MLARQGSSSESDRYPPPRAGRAGQDADPFPGQRLVASVSRVGDVLRLFSPDWPERHVSEIARLLGVSKSTAHSLLTTMGRIGLLRRAPNGAYRLGWQLLNLGGIVQESTGFRTAAAPVMKWLVDRYGETVHLATIVDGQCIYVDKIEGTRSIRIGVSYVGALLPLHCSGVGKVLLANRSSNDVHAIIAAHGLKRFTRNTITSWEALDAELALVRTRGLALDQEETMPELSCVAAPIHDHAGNVVAAISLSTPASRMKRFREEYRHAILAAGHRISGDLGYCRPRR